MKIPLAFLASAATTLTLLAPAARADRAFLVQWDGAYLTRQTGGEKLNLTEEKPVNGPDGQTLGVGFVADEEPLSPSASTYDSVRPSAVFFGVLEMENPSRAAEGDLTKALRSLNVVSSNFGRNIVNLAGKDPAEGGTSTCRGLVYWKVKDSPHAASVSQGLSLSDLLCVSVEVAKINNKLSRFQFAVQSDGKWFLSECRGTRTGWTILEDGAWAEWPVTGAFPLPPFPENYPVPSSDLTNITAIGLAFSGASSTPGNNAVFGFRSFYVELAPHRAK